MSKYFKIKNAWQELKESKGALNTTLATAKLVGKGTSNTVVFTVSELIPELLSSAAKENKKALKRTDLSMEERAKIESKLNKYEDLKPNIERMKNFKK